MFINEYVLNKYIRTKNKVLIKNGETKWKNKIYVLK